ncbi:Hsp20/alpha crystallin family protein [Neptunomonas qingdaonensis]|uniref:HSP20 family protein n=1 Tax=Neptunomonas qingdaonensis TaxID=1045558 RepID=A0A1I2SIR3_9GAMM|nr:Hsp20/alpha crystallin family protein [Neptunomonas qingdaonensis]SFG52745.1 HSP20 family protein [Neptunomonas qingdaonensis]
MNLEKLKPWNWFKHEEDSGSQIPVSKNKASADYAPEMSQPPQVADSAAGSFLQLHQEMDRLFDDVWRSFGFTSSPALKRSAPLSDSSLFDNAALGAYRAKLNVSGGEKEYEISIELPGLSEDDIHIDLQGNVLTIQGQKEEVNEDKDKHYYRVERSSGSFQRTLSLPDDADTEGMTATMRNGLLTLSIPRKATPNEAVRRIPISS